MQTGLGVGRLRPPDIGYRDGSRTLGNRDVTVLLRDDVPAAGPCVSTTPDG